MTAERLRFIDGDSHVLEPESIWENYLEKKYRDLINGHVRWVRVPSENGGNGHNGDRTNSLAFELELEVMGRRPWANGTPTPPPGISRTGTWTNWIPPTVSGPTRTSPPAPTARSWTSTVLTT